MSTKEILTTKEVAKYLNLHPLTVSKHAREGRIPAFKIGTDWRFHKKHINRWIQEKLALQMDEKKGSYADRATKSRREGVL